MNEYINQKIINYFQINSITFSNLKQLIDGFNIEFDIMAKITEVEIQNINNVIFVIIDSQTKEQSTISTTIKE